MHVRMIVRKAGLAAQLPTHECLQLGFGFAKWTLAQGKSWESRIVRKAGLAAAAVQLPIDEPVQLGFG